MSLNKLLSILLAGGLIAAVPFHAFADKDGRFGAQHSNFQDDDDDDDGGHAYGKANRAAREAAYEAKLIAHFTVLAGSADNATSLVRGVHGQTTVMLTRTVTITVPGSDPCPRPDPRHPVPPPPGCGQPSHTETTTETVSFDPPTRPMRYKNVAIALAFMELGFQDQGVATPTLEQIKDSLVGEPKGILTLRAKHKSWARIAHILGFRLHDLRQQVRAD